jgi:hypothetical protein
MTPPLPLPVRVAAGLVVTAVEQARELPRLALELPVTAVSQALQVSMRFQQKVTELAIKGDRVLGTGTPIEDEPAWATFDEDLPARRNGAAARAETAAPRPDLAPVEPGPVETSTVDPGLVAPGSVDPEPVPTALANDAADGPEALPGYATLTIPQLRGRLRHLGLDDLRALLAWEQAHGDRPPYVTMLSNRIATITEAG